MTRSGEILRVCGSKCVLRQSKSWRRGAEHDPPRTLPARGVGTPQRSLGFGPRSSGFQGPQQGCHLTADKHWFFAGDSDSSCFRFLPSENRMRAAGMGTQRYEHLQFALISGVSLHTRPQFPPPAFLKLWSKKPASEPFQAFLAFTLTSSLLPCLPLLNIPPAQLLPGRPWRHPVLLGSELLIRHLPQGHP